MEINVGFERSSRNDLLAKSVVIRLDFDTKFQPLPIDEDFQERIRKKVQTIFDIELEDAQTNITDSVDNECPF